MKNFYNFIVRYSFLLIFTVYAAGFFVWNFYLTKFGFFEYNLIQVRYISAGLLLFLFPFVFVCLAIFVEVLVKDKNKSVLISKIFFSLAIIWPIGIFFFFPVIPQYLGGAKPIPVAIIGTPDQIKFFENFGIKPADNANNPSVQSYPICLIYQNDEHVLFFSANNFINSDNEDGRENLHFESRSMSISRDSFIGTQLMLDKQAKSQCGLGSYFYNKILGVVLLKKFISN